MPEVSIDSCKKEVLIGYIGILYRKFKERFPNEPINFTEVKHGEWEENKRTSISAERHRKIHYSIYKCSICNHANGRHKSNFCSNCGADMRQTKDGE